MVRKLLHTVVGAVASLLLLNSASLMAASCSAKSGANTVPLLELYTSEGCSSCPPADKWLSNLKTDYAKFTPLAFHVDYWDYIGWKDKFSKSAYSDRQRKIAAFSGAGFVYTPQFVMNGRDFKGSDLTRFNQYVEAHQKLASPVDLSLEVLPHDSGALILKAKAGASKPFDDQKTDIFVAIYQNKLSNKINAGENNGRELKHDYVVREFFGAYQLNNLNVFAKNFKLDPIWQGRDAGAVIFMQDASNGKILQSLALPFCKS